MCLGLTIGKTGIMITYVGVFPVTNNHKLGGLKQVYSHSGRPEVQNSFHWAKIKVSIDSVGLLQRPGGESLIASSVSDGCWHSLTCGYIITISALSVMLPVPLLFLSDVPPPPSSKDVSDCI